MRRKLRNSANAMLLSAALCATGAFVAAAVPFAAPTVGVAAAARVDPGHRKAPHSARMRHVLAMPYFSFLPRG